MADIFTDVGETLVADQMDNNTASATLTWFVAQGTGAVVPVKGSTTISTEASEARVATTDSQPTTNSNRYIATITADGVKTITNAGVLDASTSGNLFLASNFAGIAVVASDSIQYTFTITWS